MIVIILRFGSNVQAQQRQQRRQHFEPFARPDFHFVSFLLFFFGHICVDNLIIENLAAPAHALSHKSVLTGTHVCVCVVVGPHVCVCVVTIQLI